MKLVTVVEESELNLPENLGEWLQEYFNASNRSYHKYFPFIEIHDDHFLPSDKKVINEALITLGMDSESFTKNFYILIHYDW